MRKIPLITGIGVFIFFMVAVGTAYAYSNLQVDPGYESATSASVSGGLLHASINTTITHSGSKSMAMNATGAVTGQYAYANTRAGTAVINYKTLNVSFWVYATSSNPTVELYNLYGGSAVQFTIPSPGVWTWEQFYWNTSTYGSTYWQTFSNSSVAFSNVLFDDIDVHYRDNDSTVTLPVASFTGAPTSGVSPLQVTFTDASTGYPATWNWNFGDGTANVTTQSPTHLYNNSGIYTVMLTVTNVNGTSTFARPSYINAIAQTMPVASFSGSPTSGLAPLQVSFTDASTGYPTSWNWNFGDGTANSTVQNPVHTYTNSGVYTVMLTVTNGNGTSTIQNSNYITTTSNTVNVGFITNAESSAWGQFVNIEVDRSGPSNSSVMVECNFTSTDLVWGRDFMYTPNTGANIISFLPGQTQSWFTLCVVPGNTNTSHVITFTLSNASGATIINGVNTLTINGTSNTNGPYGGGPGTGGSGGGSGVSVDGGLLMVCLVPVAFYLYHKHGGH